MVAAMRVRSLKHEKRISLQYRALKFLITRFEMHRKDCTLYLHRDLRYFFVATQHRQNVFLLDKRGGTQVARILRPSPYEQSKTVQLLRIETVLTLC